MFERILLPVDGSELSTRAVPYAIAMARSLQIPVHILQVVSIPILTSLTAMIGTATWERVIEAEKQEAFRFVNQVKARFASTGVRTTTDVETGDAAVRILDFAAEHPHTLIVMATHGRTGLARWVLGSVAEKVVRSASSPVLLVPAFAKEAGVLRRVLIPLDEADLAAGMDPELTELARRLGAEIILLHIFPAGTAGAQHGKLGSRLQEIEQPLKSQGLTVQSVLREGNAAAQIAGYARENAVDLIVIASQGRAGTALGSLGSVTDKIAHAIPVPMLLLGAPTERRTLPPDG